MRHKFCLILHHFCSHVIHAGQRMVSKNFHTVDCPFRFDLSSLVKLMRHSFGCLHQDHITLQIRNINLVVKECGLHFTEAYFPLKMFINLVSSDTTQLTPKNAALTPCSLSHCLLTTVAFIAERKGYAKKLLPTSPTYLLLLLARMVAHFDRFTLVVWK